MLNIIYSLVLSANLQTTPEPRLLEGYSGNPVPPQENRENLRDYTSFVVPRKDELDSQGYSLDNQKTPIDPRKNKLHAIQFNRAGTRA